MGLLAFADFSAVDHRVLLVPAAVDSESTEGTNVEVHTRLARTTVFRHSFSK